MEPQNQNNSIEEVKDLFSRFGFIGLGIAYVALASTVWLSLGHLNIYAILAETILVLIGAYLLIRATLGELTGVRSLRFLVLPIVAGATTFLIYLFFQMPTYGTDAIAIDVYAAHLFLQGSNPYIPQNMVDVHRILYVPPYYITPFTTGGNIAQVTYPSLSFLLFLPVVLLKIPPTVLLIVFAVIPFFLLRHQYSKRGLDFAYPLAALTLVINAQYFYYSAGSGTDIVWIVFLMISYMLLDREIPSGVFMGLAISFKQLPVILLPFFVYMLYKERGFRSSLRYTLSALCIFALLNVYFLAMSPLQYLTAIVSPETMPLIGVGFGLSQISFLGYANIPRIVFPFLGGLVLLASFAAYVRYYQRLKYAFLVFPVLVLLFNYRLLINYVFYWPFLLLPVIPDLTRMRLSKVRPLALHVKLPSRKLMAVLISLLIFTPAFFATAFVNYDEPLQITGVGGLTNPYQIPGHITIMTVNMSYYGSQRTIPLYFRIFEEGAFASANGLLWVPLGNNTISYGEHRTFTLVPSSVADLLSANKLFRIIAYYENIQATYDARAPYLSSPLVANPSFSYFDSTSTPGWYWSPIIEDCTANYSVVFDPHGLKLGINVLEVNSIGWRAAQIYQPLNLTGAAQGNTTLTLQIATNLESSVNTEGFPVNFVGVEIGFNNWQQQIWIGYNSSFTQQSYNPRSSLVVLLEEQPAVDFPQVLRIAHEMNWTVQDVGLMLILGTTSSPGSFTAVFYNMTIS